MRHKKEHSLRNQDVGTAYMIMTDVYMNCQKQSMSATDILEAIERAKPWRSGHPWLDKAWKIARCEFCTDYGLTPTTVPPRS